MDKVNAPRSTDSTTGAYIRRALTHSNTWKQVHEEIERSTQVLINNGFSEKDINRLTKIIDSWYNSKQKDEKKEEIKIFYKATFSTAYEEEEERVIRQIVKRNIKPSDPDKQLKLIIFYKTKKTSHLLLKNNPHNEKESLQKSHVIYRFTCNQGNCEVLPSTYIGMTTTRLSRRLTCHLTSGAPKTHLREQHDTAITRDTLENSTEVITTCADARRLPILEALYIKEMSPTLNVQADDLQASPSARRSGFDSNTAQSEVTPSPRPASQSRSRTRSGSSRSKV